MMRIGFISTRLAGTDGVSLEVEKWSRVLQRMGHQVFFCAGELGGYAGAGALIPELHFTHPAILQLNQRAFGEATSPDASSLNAAIRTLANELRPQLRHFIDANQLDVIIVQNALAIPMNLPLGVGLAELIAETKIPTIAHHHDFYWERQRYQASAVPEILDACFPPQLPAIQHVTINSIAQQRLKARRGIDSLVVPNVHDFATPPPGIDAYNRDFRHALGLQAQDLMILQPTRVIQRKGIELSIELVNRLGRPNTYLYITHRADDEGLSYWNWLTREAVSMQVPLVLIDHMIAVRRSVSAGSKRYTLWDAYPHANLVTYPSLYEGFGNALLETIYFKRLAVVNRYPVYVADLAPLGFEFVELEGFVGEAAVRQVRELLHNPDQVRQMTEKNYQVAQEHFSLETLEKKIKQLLANIA
jgi:glycosyltransferase involved in cell wall biosynthesis